MVRTASGGRLDPRPFLDVRNLVDNAGEQGLLSIAFPPDYTATRLVYAFFSHDNGMEIHSYRVVDGRADRSTDRLLVRAPHTDSPFHNGGQLAFGPDGLLYAGIGDGGYTDQPRPLTQDPHGNAQNLGVLLGKIFRLDPAAPSPRPKIVAYGLRNPWRFSFDASGNLIIGDVGWNTAEEVDVLPAGAGLANFGWDVFEGNTSVPNPQAQLNPQGELRRPVLTYRTQRHANCAIVGGYVYRGRALPALRGRYFFGDYCSGRIWSVKIGARGVTGRRLERIRRLPGLTSFGEDAAGELYAVTLGDRPNTGAMYKLGRK